MTVTTETRLSILGQDNGNMARSKVLSHVSAVPVKNAKAGFCSVGTVTYPENVIDDLNLEVQVTLRYIRS